MYFDNPTLKKPDNDTRIWRYMTLAKFVSLLAKNALFFTSIAILQNDDPFEGMLTKANLSYRERLFESDEYKGIEGQFSLSDEITKKMLLYTLVNCWHINEVESAAMWKLYLLGSEGIAIRSTFQRLTSSFVINESSPPDNKNNSLMRIEASLVPYIDYVSGASLDFINEAKGYDRFIHKDISFRHEKELRLLTTIYPLHLHPTLPLPDGYNFKSFEAIDRDGGLYFPISLETLIEAIVFPPTAPDWVKEVIQSLLNKYVLDVPLMDSRFQIYQS